VHMAVGMEVVVIMLVVTVMIMRVVMIAPMLVALIAVVMVMMMGLGRGVRQFHGLTHRAVRWGGA